MESLAGTIQKSRSKEEGVVMMAYKEETAFIKGIFVGVAITIGTTFFTLWLLIK